MGSCDNDFEKKSFRLDTKTIRENVPHNTISIQEERGSHNYMLAAT